jgi:hypothetical protein
MKRILVLAVIALAAVALAEVVLLAQQPRESARAVFEMRSVFPRETSPGQYAQADPETLQSLSSQGWELVSVTPFIYRNEEHNNGEMRGPKPVVTQVYPAYFFRRVR